MNIDLKKKKHHYLYFYFNIWQIILYFVNNINIINIYNIVDMLQIYNIHILNSVNKFDISIIFPQKLFLNFFAFHFQASFFIHFRLTKILSFGSCESNSHWLTGWSEFRITPMVTRGVGWLTSAQQFCGWNTSRVCVQWERETREGKP